MNVPRIQLGLGCLFAASIALSTVHPWGNPRSRVRSDTPLLEASDVPETVRITLAGKCGDCHSERTHYPIYAHLAPLSWMIDRDVRQGRRSLDMSQWQSMTDESRISVLTRMASVVHTGQMPPSTYVMLHREAQLSPDEQQLIYAWAKTERTRIRQQLNHRSDESSAESRTGKP